MRILILGGDGMLGHRLLLHLQERHETKVTLRRGLPEYGQYGLFTPENSYTGVEARDVERLLEVFGDFRPEALVNCVGIIKQRGEAKEAIPSIEINALLPHRLAVACKAIGARLVHLSTDCVFSGRKGDYTLEDVPDAEDLYGRTKLLGEVGEEPAVTLRTSIIGLELARKGSLIEWFLAQRGEIRGFTEAIYTGLTTAEMSRVIEKVLVEHPDLSGVWQVASEKIDKYDLLSRFSRELGRDDVSVTPDASVKIDRSLSGLEFAKATGYDPPGWDAMLAELALEVQARKRQGS